MCHGIEKGGGSEHDKGHRRENTDDDKAIDRGRKQMREEKRENHKLKNILSEFPFKKYQ